MEVPAITPGCSPRSGCRRATSRRSARWSRSSRVRAGRRRARLLQAGCVHAAAPAAPKPASALVPAKAGIPGPRTGLCEAREPAPTIISIPSSKCARRTRNFGPASTSGGTHVTPLARRLAGENGIDLSRSPAPARMAASSRATSRRRRQRRGPRRARDGDGCAAEQVKALYQGAAFEEAAARRHAPHHRDAAGRGQADHPALLSDRRRDDGRALRLREEANAGAPKAKDGRRPTSSRSTTSSLRRWRSRCSACPPPMRCGRATASCASGIPTSAWRWRSRAACSRR